MSCIPSTITRMPGWDAAADKQTPICLGCRVGACMSVPKSNAQWQWLCT